MLKYFRARIFDWQESPLPDANALPRVRPCTWVPEGLSAKTAKNQLLFSWLGHAACHWSIPVPQSTGESLSSSSSDKPIVILTDPVFSKRCSPVQFMGPQRYTNPPTSVQEMSTVTDSNVWPDLLVLSHNHYDHLDYDTVKEILSEPNGKPRPHIFCTSGMATWFHKHLGIPNDGVTELDWWQERIAILEGNRRIKLTCVPAQHFSGRSLTDRDQTLWAGWVFEALPSGNESSSSSAPTAGKKIYFAGDSGYRTVPYGTSAEGEKNLETCPAFKEIGDKLGPFDHAAIPIGAYLPRSFMSAIHVSFIATVLLCEAVLTLHHVHQMNPYDAVCAHKDVKSKKSIGIHWVG